MNLHRKTLGAVFSVVLLDLLGFGIVVPVIAPLFVSDAAAFGASFSVSTREIMLGCMIAIYPLMQFFAAPFLGALADRFGRRRLLMACLAATILDYILCAIAIATHQFWLLLLSRAIAGFLGGNIAIARAVIADVSTEETKAKNFGIIGIAVGIGFIIGPFLGSVFSDPQVVSWFSFSTPFWLSALLAASSLLVVWLHLPETLKHPVKKPITLLTGPRHIVQAFKIPFLRSLFSTAFLQLFGFAIYTQFFQVFFIERFNPSQLAIGLAIGYIGILVVLAQGLLNPLCVRSIGERKLVAWSLLILAITIAGVAFSYTLPVLLIYLGISALASGFLYPNITALVSNSAGEENQGEIMGLYQSVESLAQAVGPFIAGFAAVRGESVPLLIGAGSIAVAWVVFSSLFRAPATTVYFEE
jgi:DHA1 family tetracycline resistance protein-like MFS transporter